MADPSIELTPPGETSSDDDDDGVVMSETVTIESNNMDELSTRIQKLLLGVGEMEYGEIPRGGNFVERVMSLKKEGYPWIEMIVLPSDSDYIRIKNLCAGSIIQVEMTPFDKKLEKQKGPQKNNTGHYVAFSAFYDVTWEMQQSHCTQIPVALPEVLKKLNTKDQEKGKQLFKLKPSVLVDGSTANAFIGNFEYQWIIENGRLAALDIRIGNVPQSVIEMAWTSIVSRRRQIDMLDGLKTEVKHNPQESYLDFTNNLKAEYKDLEQHMENVLQKGCEANSSPGTHYEEVDGVSATSPYSPPDDGVNDAELDSVTAVPF
jgi:hypothetical protein